MQKISPSEVTFIQQGVENNIRSDGRNRVDYRNFSLETGEIIHANGSARVKLSDTEVLVGVKAEITHIQPKELTNTLQTFDTSKRLVFSVNCCPSASPEFEGKGSEFLNIELGKQLERLYKFIFNKSNYHGNDNCLSIVSGKYYWTLYIDAIVLDSDGNLFDALSIATRAALYNTRLPRVKAIQGEYEEITFEVSDDPEDTLSLSIENAPICVTLTKIGTQFVIDSTLQEELCMDARLTVGINSHSNICSIQKGGIQGLDPATINQMINTSKVIGTKILNIMDKTLKENCI
ncbi:hypothetical protein DICPUDRAFT_29826 [Dictyostelium purpureum]|uniref:Ribosomal RNA-processing protein 42 n=1 Tax=Dictyostelium purpureum TaxID=5786 RepID=F0ZEA5_DICPU|nr:uncharacterized protein DICPUDRAFT_29826 [Dictyostelium purpureum]EGC37720.1 hypothetical protein DICPUDRAFT_29826 [Dictyostelium purpureum]|eukprot:XP_003285741.1 hypothetical protein DICPUDRAFT_29826 [Dictyostelium purpureum]